MSIATRITSIENHLKDDYIEIARLGADLTNVDKNIENIAETIREAYSKMPKVLVTGSNVSLSPTLKGGLDITPLGACEQDSYSGKNLIGLIDGTYPSMQNEITAVVSNGKITLNGTATKTNLINISANTNYSSISNNDNFTISLNNSVVNEDVRFRVNNYAYYDTFIDEINKVATYTYNDTHAFETTIVMVRVQSGVTLSNYTLQPQIQKGSSATTYEKYVGGIPAPNPSYPQDVRVVTEDNDVVVQNKNLINSVETHKYITSTGNMLTGEKYLGIEDYVNIQPNTTYVVSFEHDVTTSTLYIGYKDKNNSFISRVNVGSNRTFTTPNNAVKCIFYLYDGTTEFASIGGYVQLEYGDTPTTYIAHAEQKITLHLGSNYLAGIGEYKYEIVGKTDDWKILRKVGKANLKDLSWIIGAAQPTDTSLIMFASTSLTNRIDGANLAPLCNYLTYNGYASGANSGKDKGIGFWFLYNTTSHSKNIYIIIPKTIASTTTELINWANTNNVVLYYQLEEPTEEPITDQTLIQDLNNMYNAMGYDGQTNITITSNSSNAQMTAQVKALKGE